MRFLSLYGIPLLFVLSSCSGDGDNNNQSEDGDIICEFSNTPSEDCPTGMICEYRHNADRSTTEELICHEYCSTDEECPAHRPNCSPGIAFGSYVCSAANFNPRSCDPLAEGDDCTCGIKTFPSYRVEGSGEDCEIIEEDLAFCFEQSQTCLNSCQPQFFRYDLDDGTALIVQALQGGISLGWQAEGQNSSPASCPAVTMDDEI